MRVLLQRSQRLIDWEVSEMYCTSLAAPTCPYLALSCPWLACRGGGSWRCYPAERRLVRLI